MENSSSSNSPTANSCQYSRDMKTTLVLSGVVLGLVGSANPALIRSAKELPVPPVYPIGTKKEAFAKPAGLLFEIDDKVHIFPVCSSTLAFLETKYLTYPW